MTQISTHFSSVAKSEESRMILSPAAERIAIMTQISTRFSSVVKSEESRMILSPAVEQTLIKPIALMTQISTHFSSVAKSEESWMISLAAERIAIMTQISMRFSSVVKSEESQMILSPAVEQTLIKPIAIIHDANLHAFLERCEEWGIADDIASRGTNCNHDANLHVFLKRCEEQGIRLNEEIRHELTSDNSIVLKGLRCVILASMRTEIHKKLHASHTGLQNTLWKS